METSTKIFVGLGVVAIVSLIAYILFANKKGGGGWTEVEKEEKEKEDAFVVDPRSLPLPEPKDAPEPITATTTTSNYTAKPLQLRDPLTEVGQGIIAFRMSELGNNENAMYTIRQQSTIGSNLFDGVSTQPFNFGNKGTSPVEDITEFLQAIGKNFDEKDYGTYPVFSKHQKPNLHSEWGSLAENTYVTGDYKALNQSYHPDFNIRSLSDENVLSYFGGHYRKHKFNSFRNARTFAQNYRDEMDRLDTALYNAAIESLLQTDNIRFLGINF